MAAIEPGMAFGFLQVIRKEMVNGRGMWLVLCECGTQKHVQPSQLHGAKRPTKSCGCKKIGLLRAAQTTHGCSVKNNSPEYRTYISWQSMLWRCYNQKRRDYAHYGGRGIIVCKIWKDSFAKFRADMGIKPERMTLGRIDNNLGYGPDNCRWESFTQQARNKRNNHLVEWRGAIKTITEWAIETGIEKSKLRQRIVAGWPVEKAMSP